MQARAFLEQHRPRMIELARGASPALLRNAEVEAFLNRIHKSFETVEDRPSSRPALPGEDVFWWCVTILEDLSDLPPSDTALDPYVELMLSQLRDMAPRLERLEPLPPDHRIYWFDDAVPLPE